MSKAKDHESYIAAAPRSLRAELMNVREVLAKALPDAEEVIKYNMPGFQIGDAIVVGYAAFTKQCGIYVQGGAIEVLAKEIADAKLTASKTGVKFAPGAPIPSALVRKLAKASRKELGV